MSDVEKEIVKKHKQYQEKILKEKEIAKEYTAPLSKRLISVYIDFIPIIVLSAILSISIKILGIEIYGNYLAIFIALVGYFIVLPMATGCTLGEYLMDLTLVKRNGDIPEMFERLDGLFSGETFIVEKKNVSKLKNNTL
ncbi:MAG: RDD family protein [Candidatus Omnitrophica bacterium]|nr:RDD family protein [Candidatus Omnitrophota bacterium]